MENKDINELLSATKAPLNHPLFFPRVFALVSKRQRQLAASAPSPINALMIKDYEELSRRLERSKIQESCSVRNVLYTRDLANLIIDEKGDINDSLLGHLIEFQHNNLYSIGPQRQFDAKRQEHILTVLTLLKSNKELARLLKNITRPSSHKLVEEIIRSTLQLKTNEVITDAHAKRTVLAAWLCYLRQNVGSCFATAPAIIIQHEQPENFLKDMSELLGTGRLKRTFGGVEYSVPMSASWGSGDLKKPLVIQIGKRGIFPEIWYSQGLIAAFEGAEVLNPQDTLKQKVLQVKNWIEPLIKQKIHHSFYCILTAEEIIRTLLMHLYGITEEQLREFENRPRDTLHSHLMIRPSVKGVSKGMSIGEKCIHFHYNFEKAKNSFKALSDNALLKTWEFTLASFSETKFEFTGWNLYSSLGLKANEVGGIGYCIYETIQKKVDQANKKVQDLQGDYEVAYTQVKTIESRLRHTSTEQELQWVKMEYQNRLNEFYFIDEQRQEAQSLAKGYVNLYETLYKVYTELFKDYFQEVYDADMQEVTTGPFDDSPAGFRLIYKHGRTNTSQWTRINNQHDFIDALMSFFVATEHEIEMAIEDESIKKTLGELITTLITHVKSKEFLESAFNRMAIAHQTRPIKDPLEHLDQIEKKPWVYTSGGTMNTLVSCYYRIEGNPTEESKWFESELELLVFLTDTVKRMPYRLIEPFLSGKRSSILINSPTHAFTLKPTYSYFKECWSNQEFTYTFVRDRFIKTAQNFVEEMILDDEHIQVLVELLKDMVPENFHPRFKEVFKKLSGPLNPTLFREAIIETIAADRGLKYGGKGILSAEEIDSFLYAKLPLSSINELSVRVEKVIKRLPGLTAESIDRVLKLIEESPLSRTNRYVTADQFQDICKALICLATLSPNFSNDLHLHITLISQKLGFAMPAPIIFADSNWIKDEFGFVVNPGSGRLELWRVDPTGSSGHPLNSWKQWVDGSRPDLKWSVYTNPLQYGQF